MSKVLQTEIKWLDLIQSSKLVGICLLDSDGQLVTRIDGDEQLREAIIEYQTQRVHELSLSADGQSSPAPAKTSRLRRQKLSKK